MVREYKAEFKHQEWCNALNMNRSTSDATAKCNCGHDNQVALVNALSQQLTEAKEEKLPMLARLAAQKTKTRAALGRAEKAEALYQDLIMQVACRFPNESRHETAKRYISERENTEPVECKEVE